VDIGVLSQLQELIDFRSRTRAAATPADADHVGHSAEGESTPRETIAKAVIEANNAVAAEVLDRVREREPAFLERLVLMVFSTRSIRSSSL